MALALLAGVVGAAVDAQTGSGATAVNVVPAQADTYLDATSPLATHGADRALEVDARPERTTLIRFMVPPSASLSQIVSLRLFVETPVKSGFDIRLAGTDWNERTVSQATRPATGPVVASVGPVPGHTAVDVALPVALVVGEPVAFAVSTTDDHGVKIASRETDRGPTLALFLGDQPSPPPAPTILSVPESPTSSTTAVFEFSDAQAGVTFLCTVDGGPATRCTSPATFTVSAGTHRFAVQARDSLGQDSPTASATWVVEAVTP